jgi:8-oxo-dGTP pyrophosphatase MutT (NUDIX family)
MNNPWNFPRLLPEPPPGGDVPRAAVLAPLYEDGPDIRLVLIRRPVHMPTHGGDVAFPGGKPEPGEGPLDTALREAREEVGIAPEEVEVLGYLPAIHTVTYPRMVVPVVGRLDGVPDLVPDPNEVDRILTPSIRLLEDESRWRSEQWNGRAVYFFDIDGDVLWGATARMVRHLLGLGGY